MLTVCAGKSDLPVSLKVKMAAEIASGMSYLHTFADSPIIHGDLKLQNILIGADFNDKASSNLSHNLTV